MAKIPTIALVLGLAGVIPFAATSLAPIVIQSSYGQELSQAFLSLYSVTILAFMSGCIWAFATTQQDYIGYGLSTLPALFGCFAPFLPIFFGLITPNESLVLLAVGFVLLLFLDRRAFRLGQTPDWWLKLRVMLTACVVVFLLIGAAS